MATSYVEKTFLLCFFFQLKNKIHIVWHCLFFVLPLCLLPYVQCFNSIWLAFRFIKFFIHAQCTSTAPSLYSRLAYCLYVFCVALQHLNHCSFFRDDFIVVKFIHTREKMNVCASERSYHTSKFHVNCVLNVHTLIRKTITPTSSL